jgi:hypothetical protein
LAMVELRNGSSEQWSDGAAAHVPSSRLMSSSVANR